MWPGCSAGFSSSCDSYSDYDNGSGSGSGSGVKINMHAVAFIRHGKGALRIRIAYTSAISTDAPPLRRLSHICMQ